MKQAWRELPGTRESLRLIAASMAMLALAGCSVLYHPNPLSGGTYEPANVYRAGPTLPAELRRVAALPMSAASSVTDAEAGIEALEPILHSELARLQRFEVVVVTPDQMRQWTGKPAWRSDEALPASFFVQLRDGTGCDAVLFSHLSRYQPYEPLAIGWRLSLVWVTAGTTPHTQILWSVDELVDGGKPEVANAARAYHSQHLRNESPASDSSVILSSPRRFGQFSLGTLLATLPERGNP
jgi:hypothetical protein